MKKSKLKLAVKNAMQEYYKAGMTNTANNVYQKIIKSIEKEYEKIHNQRPCGR